MSRLILLTILLCCPYSLFAQTSDADETEVPILSKVSSRCWFRPVEFTGPVVDEQTFRKLTAPGNPDSPTYNSCDHLENVKVDFSKQSLLTYRVNGDCFVRATATLTRNDTTRTYTLRVTRIYGGCRAAGAFESWLVVDKLRSDYKVETDVLERDNSAQERITEDGAPWQ